MVIQPLTPLVIPPTQSTPAASWPDQADAFVADQYRWSVEFNSTTIPAINATAAQVNSDADEASQAAADASLDRSEASIYKNAAELAASNAATSESNASGYASGASASATAALGYRDEAETYRDQALQYRNEAEAIVGPIGTAASRDVQTSPIDTTPGRLMAVGAGGWMGDVPISPFAADIDDRHMRGWRYVSVTTVGVKPSTYGQVLTFGNTDDQIGQEFWEVTGSSYTNRRWYRQCYGNGAWGEWDELFHTGNWYRGADKQQTIPSASGSLTLDLDTYSVFDIALTGATTLSASLSYLPTNGVRSVVVRVRQGATAQTLTWWPGITWLAATTPAAPGANKIAEYVLSHSIAGWIGRVGAKN